MAAILKCDQCGKADDLMGADRNRPHWPWFRVHDTSIGDGLDYDLCSAECLVKWAKVRVSDRKANTRHYEIGVR